MTPVLALDLSATKAGVALPDGTLMTLEGPKGWPKGCDEVAERLSWWWDCTHLLMAENRPAVVAVENYAFAAKHNMARIAEVTGVVRLVTRDYGAAWDDRCGPGTLKKWATGNGRAGKDAMIEAARARGYNPANDDEADAALLREWVLEHLEVVG